MKKILLISIAILLLVSTVISDESRISAEDLIKIKENVENSDPTFTVIETTAYYSPSSEDLEWYTGVGEEYDTTTSLGWCIIPENKRGFYEEVKCQGSGVHNNRVYQYNTIEPTVQDSIPIPSEFTAGRTATSTNPERKWTVAVNPDRDTDCYIPYGTLLYIDFGKDHDWTGVYRAEDTGAAFRGECKMDIYAGVGKDALQDALNAGISGRTPDIYLLDDEYQILDPRRVDTSSVHGTLSTRYSHKQKVNLTLFEEVNRFSRQTFDCRRASNKTSCVNNLMENYNTINYCDDYLNSSSDDVISEAYELNLLKVIKSLADCNSNINCGCELEADIGGTYNFSNGSISFGGLTFNSGVNITFNGRSEFELIVDPNDPVQFNSTNTGLEVYGGLFEEEQLCEPLKEHFFMCASYEDSVLNDSEPVKFTVKI